MSSLQKVAVVIPCRNEGGSIAKVIAKFPHHELQERGLLLKIFVVNNNSTDNTAAVAVKAGATVIEEARKGKGNAMRTGFSHVPDDTDYVVMIDGDDTYSPAEILRMLEPLYTNFCDVVIGSRLGGRIQTTAMNRLNQFGNKLFTTAVRLLYKTNITDVLTGYFAWKKSAFDSLSPHITSPGFAVEMEMITKMAQLGQHMVSVPISYHPRTGQTKLQPVRDGLRILAMLFKNLAWRPPRVAFISRKIVFVSDAIYPYMKGGKEKRLHEITKRLAAMGHDVHIYTMKWWEGSAKTRQEHGVTLHALCDYYQMYKGDRRTIKEGLLFGVACLKLINVKFDVLDVDQMPFFPIFSVWLVCALRGRRFYATWHEALSHKEWVGYMGIGGVVAALVERLCVNLPHRITAASAHTKELLASIHGRVERVDLVSSGIDTSLLQSVPAAPTQCDVLYVGRLVKDKHVAMLVAAIGIVSQTYPSIRCVIIGQGVERQNLEQQTIQHNLQKNIIFLDPLSKAADVYSYMKAAKVFCSPSVREGFGIVTLEALGCGTPVITIDSPKNAARHLVKDGQSGSIVGLTPQALAQSIIHWVSVAEKPDTASQTAHYDWHTLAQKQAEVYML